MALEYGKSVKLTLQNLLALFDAPTNQVDRWEMRATTVRITKKMKLYGDEETMTTCC